MCESSTLIVSHYARELNPIEIEKLSKEKVTISKFKQEMLEKDAKKNWDLFYIRNKDRFFKDRHWTQREFEELADYALVGDEKPILLEIGCGVGNFIFPLIETETKFFIYACDFSPKAIQIVQENPLYQPEICNAFTCDVTREELTTFIQPNSVHVATMIFVLSAVHPEKMAAALKNTYEVLKPGGILLFRDYGLYDQAMLRFGPGHKLGDCFYVRQDGTRAFYFSEEYLGTIIQKAGFQILSNSYVKRQTVNHKKGLCVPRIYIQGKFIKPRVSNSTELARKS